MATSDPDALASAANSVVSRWENQATTFINDLRTLASTQFSPNLADPRLPVAFTTRDNEMRTAIDSAPTKPSGLAFVSPSDVGEAPTISIRDATVVAVPTFSEAAPQLDLPVRPAQQTSVRPQEPTLKSVSAPISPVITLPTPPTLSGVSFPSAPSIELPIFSQSFPEEQDFLLQTTSFGWVEPELPTPLIDEATSKLLGDLQNGGYGIEPLDEDLLWERARDREVRQGQQAEQQVLDTFANRGYELPPGAAQAGAHRAYTESQRNLSEANREIAVARAALFRETRQFAITQGTTIDATRLQHAGFRMERALNAARFSAEFAVAVHDAAIRAYNARVQAYASYVQGYRAVLEAQLTQVQIFSEQVRAAVAQQQSQQVAVDLYRALVSASQAEVGLYETQVRAVVAEIDAERIKLQAFSAQVDAYATEVRANAVQFDAYEAGVRGELAKAQVFQTQVEAYRTQVQASSVESDIQNRQVQVDIAKAQAEVAAYATEVDAYRGRITGESARVDALVREYAADQGAFSATLQAWEGLTRATIAEIEAVSRQLVNEVQLEQSNARLQLEAAVEGARRRFEAANSGTALTQAFVELAQESLGLLSAKIEEV